MSKTVLAAIAGVIWGAAISLAAQSPPGVKFGGVGGVPATGITFTYEGSADTLTQAGSVKTYRGNVIISFPTANIIVHADEVTSDAGTPDLALQGNVRIVFGKASGAK